MIKNSLHSHVCLYLKNAIPIINILGAVEFENTCTSAGYPLPSLTISSGKLSGSVHYATSSGAIPVAVIVVAAAAVLVL